MEEKEVNKKRANSNLPVNLKAQIYKHIKYNKLSKYLQENFKSISSSYETKSIKENWGK